MKPLISILSFIIAKKAFQDIEQLGDMSKLSWNIKST